MLLRSKQREKVLKWYFLVFSNCYCCKIWTSKKIWHKGMNLGSWKVSTLIYSRNRFFQQYKVIPIEFTSFLSLLAIYAISLLLLMNFFYLKENIGYIFKKFRFFITTVKIECHSKSLFPGNSASNVKHDGLKYSQ